MVRCNFYNSSKFYGSIATGEIELGYATSIFETSKLLRDKEDGYEIYSIGMWLANEDVDLFAIKPPSDEGKDSEIHKELIALFEKNFKIGATDDHKEFYELIGKEMSKEVNTKESDTYCISALTSDLQK